MRNEDSEFSSLKTVTSFDRGEGCTVTVDLDSQEISHFSPSSLLVESLIEQLCKLMEKDPDNQKKLYLRVCEKLHEMNLVNESYERQEFQFMRSHYQKALYRLLATAKTTTLENNALFPKNSCQLYLPNGGILEWSRYCNEFIELEYIAKGGFGHVFKAQHKLDGEIYAVKKISLRYNSVNDFLQNLREVKMLAKLNHPNIVAYKAAWLEPADEPNKCRSMDLCHEVPAILNVDNDFDSNNQNGNDASFDIVFEGSQKSVSIYDKCEVFSSPTSSSSALLPVEQLNCVEKAFKFHYSEENLNTLQQSATLFIQMQLCQKTLRHWLDNRNQIISTCDINVDQCLEIFKKIVRGVEYIHSQKIVHHDIKPSNIFVSNDLSEVQVGDFGLACCLLAHPPTSLSIIATHPHGQVGTRLYAAPEQLKGSCHPKSDVYSLGILMLELLLPFTTTMERTEVIGQLRAGHLPTQLTADHPNLAKVISETMNPLRQRPTSSELLKNLEELQDADTVKLVAQQSELIEKLRRESLAKDEEIAFLKKKLEEVLSNKNGTSFS